MNEKNLIREKGEQPVARITDDELNFLINREFPTQKDVVKSKLDKIKSDNRQGKNRIAASVLKLANSNFDKIDYLVRRANEDFRDIISEAEYSRASSYGFGERNEEDSKEDYMRDWEEYSTWKEKDSEK